MHELKEEKQGLNEGTRLVIAQKYIQLQELRNVHLQYTAHALNTQIQVNKAEAELQSMIKSIEFKGYKFNLDTMDLEQIKTDKKEE